jgi:hypothetical protein
MPTQLLCGLQFPMFFYVHTWLPRPRVYRASLPSFATLLRVFECKFPLNTALMKFVAKINLDATSRTISIGQGMDCTQASLSLVLARVPLILPLFKTPLNTTASKRSKEATGLKEVRRCNIFGGKRLLGYTESSHRQQTAVFMHNNPPRYLRPSCVSMAHTKTHTQHRSLG